MLSLAIILSLALVLCLITVKHMYLNSVTFKDKEPANWQNSVSIIREIKNKKLWNISMAITIISTVIHGFLVSTMVVYGLRTVIVFKQGYGIPVVALTIPISMLGHMFIRAFILEWEKRYWKRIITIILIILPISAGAVELLYQSKIETNTHTKIEVLETVKLEPDCEIITSMTVKGKGKVFAFCDVSGYDTVPEEKSKTTFIDSDPYMEKRRLTKVITAIYPNGKIEERELFSETDYMFYAPEELFYG